MRYVGVYFTYMGMYADAKGLGIWGRDIWESVFRNPYHEDYDISCVVYIGGP